MSNTGSLYIGEAVDHSTCFASERFFLETLGCSNVRQLLGQLVLDVPASTTQITIHDHKVSRPDLIPALGSRTQEEKKLIFPEPKLRRCTRCILPETMPFIPFDAGGVCNYCTHHRSRNSPKPRSVLEDLLAIS